MHDHNSIEARSASHSVSHSARADGRPAGPAAAAGTARIAAALAAAIVTLGTPAWIALRAPHLAGSEPRAESASAPAPLRAPATLAETGLYSAPANLTVRADAFEFAPQYPLWTDGAAKRRWIWLPPGESIDASDADAWRFPVGTKLWKEFAFERRVETRYMELGADGEWLYATYVWSPEESQATLAPEYGLRNAYLLAGGARHDIPGRMDCLACHAASATPVLGFSGLQLSGDRDPLAPHAQAPSPELIDLDDLISRGLVSNLPDTLSARLPRIAARSPQERAALGYLHGNCGGCHNSSGPLAQLGLDLAYSLEHGSRVASTAVGAPARYRSASTPELRIAPGAPHESLLIQRMSTRDPLLAMPALGSAQVDEAALELLREWIAADPAAPALAAHRTARR